MKKTFLFAAVIFATLCGCVKETTHSVQTNKKTLIAVTRTDGEFANPGNPYDDVGSMHNQYMDEVKPRFTQKPSLSDLILVANELNKRDLGRPYERTEAEIAALVNNGYQESDPAIKEQMDNLLDVVNHRDDYATYGEFKSRLVAFENNIMFNSQLSEQQKYVILGSSSVARYSTGYWEAATTPVGKSVIANTVSGDIAGFWGQAGVYGRNGKLQCAMTSWLCSAVSAWDSFWN